MKKAYINFNVYRKTLMFYFLLVICTVFIISTTLFYLFSKSTINEISFSSQTMLGQTSYTSELIYEKVSSLAKIINNDPQIVDVMYATSKNPIDEYNAKRRMSTISNSYSFIKYIGVFNKLTNTYITDQGVPIFDNQDSDLIKTINKGNLSDYINFIPRKSSFFLNDDSESKNVLTYIICPDYYLKQEKNAYIIINVDESYIQNLIHSMIRDNADNILVMDSQGTVLSDTNPNLFMTNIRKNSFIDKIISRKESNGYFTERVNGKNQLITFVKSNTLNWYFVRIQPYNQLISDINRLRNITLVISFILIMLSAIFSAVFLRDLYTPIRALVEKVNESMGGNNRVRNRYNEFEVISEAFSLTIDRANHIESSYNKTYNAIRESYLYCLFEGNFENMAIDKKSLEKIEAELDWPFFCMVVFKIDKYASFKEHQNSRNQLLSKFAICNISKEILEAHIHCHAIDLGKDQVGVLLCINENKLPLALTDLLERVQRTVESLYNFSFSISIGDIVNSKKEISLSYESALEYSNYRIFLGHKCIIHYDKVKHQIDHLDEYPYNIEKKILSAIESLNQTNIEESLNLFIYKISDLSFQHTLFYCHQLILTVSKKFSILIDINAKNDLKYQDFIKKVAYLETIQEINEFIKGFCLEICNTFLESKNRAYSHKIDEVKKYLQENYSDPNLSLESMAALADVSPGYFGKIFRSVYNCSFNNYLNNLRLEKAKKLLIETEETINTISETVGIPNNNYFFTLFKKTYGITPAQYRNKKHTNNGSSPSIHA